MIMITNTITLARRVLTLIYFLPSPSHVTLNLFRCVNATRLQLAKKRNLTKGGLPGSPSSPSAFIAGHVSPGGGVRCLNHTISLAVGNVSRGGCTHTRNTHATRIAHTITITRCERTSFIHPRASACGLHEKHRSTASSDATSSLQHPSSRAIAITYDARCTRLGSPSEVLTLGSSSLCPLTMNWLPSWMSTHRA